MFRPMQLSSGNSAAGQFYKGRSKAHKQLSAFHRPVEKRGQNSGQQLAVDANGTVSHSAVVAFLTGPAQMMLVHEAVQHSLRFGQQLAGNQVSDCADHASCCLLSVVAGASRGEQLIMMIVLMFAYQCA